jgi:SAM-dependent methyltransferase
MPEAPKPQDRSTEEQQAVFIDIWDRGNYRLGSPGERIVPMFVPLIPPSCVVNDYGSGTGRAALLLRRLGHPVNMVDIAPNALEEPARAALGPDFTFTLASVWDLPEDFPVAPWGFSAEMLMTIPPAKLEQTIKNIRRTCKNFFCQVYNRIDVRVGHHANLIHEGPQWWHELLEAYWPHVERIESREISLRYIYACRAAQ